jgi:hypothetical protein
MVVPLLVNIFDHVVRFSEPERADFVPFTIDTWRRSAECQAGS